MSALPPEVHRLLSELTRLTEPAAVPLERFAAEVLALYVAPLRARTTICRMRQALRELLALAGPGATTRDLTPELLARFAASHPERKPATVNGLLAALRTACLKAVARGELAASPFAGSRCFLPPAPRERLHHSRATIARVLDSLRSRSASWPGHRLYVFAAVLAYAGLRLREALRLRVEDLDLDAGFLRVCPHGRALKTPGSAASVPIPAALVVILRDWLPRCGSVWLLPGLRRKGPWLGGSSGKRAGDQLKAAAAAIGVNGCTPHSLRHSLATHLACWRGLSRKQIQLILRHTLATTQDLYIHPELSDLRALVADFEYAAEPTPLPLPPPRRPARIPRRRFRHHRS